MQWRGPILRIFVFFSHTYARWKGTGEPCPNFLWKSSKFSLHRFKKYFVFWYPYEPLFHLPYKVWTLTPWFRLWHFWTTVFGRMLFSPQCYTWMIKSLISQKFNREWCSVNRNKNQFSIKNICKRETAMITELQYISKFDNS